MAVRLVVTFQAVKGKGDEFAKAFGTIVPSVLQEKGCEQYELFRSVGDPDKLVLLERWADQAALDAHGAALRARGGVPGADLRAGPPMLERFQV